MEQIIFIAAFVLIYFHISGLATTNILRLTAGNTLPVLASKCVCDHCGAPITPLLQLPIISYLICRGKCRNCKVKLPVDALLLEILMWVGMIVLSAVFGFSLQGVTLSFLYYELVRILLVVKKGRRQERFGKQYGIAVLAMIPFYLITLFVALLYSAVCK